MTTPESKLVDRMTAFDCVVEIGIGNRPGVARRLAERGVSVTATDVQHRSVPAAVRFVVDDITDPTLAVYEGADLVFARNLPPELHRPTRTVAQSVGAAFWFTTLGGDQPTIPVDREQLAGGETLYRARNMDSKALE